MDIERAKEILGYLADGIDPFTGALLDKDSICNQADVVRAFHTIQTELDKRKRNSLPENSGKPWTDELDKELAEMWQKQKMRKNELQYGLPRQHLN